MTSYQGPIFKDRRNAHPLQLVGPYQPVVSRGPKKHWVEFFALSNTHPLAFELVATFGGAMTFNGGTTGEGHSTQG